MSADAERDFLESLSASSLYSIGAYFCDRHPELVEDVVAQAEAIEEDGLALWARGQDVPLESAFQTLVTALAIRYFKAVAGPA